MASADGVISTHILDTVTGEPASSVQVRLDQRAADAWQVISDGRTDGDGRLRCPVPADRWRPGEYRLTFQVGDHVGPDAFFPEIAVAFRVAATDRSYHVPLLLSRYGYTTYRGS